MCFKTLTPIHTSQQLKHNTYKKTQQKGAMLKMILSTYTNKKIKEEPKIMQHDSCKQHHNNVAAHKATMLETLKEMMTLYTQNKHI